MKLKVSSICYGHELLEPAVITEMALHDNRLWLLSHIHNSFISSDDTGICEMVLAPETFKEELTKIAKEQVYLSSILSLKSSIVFSRTYKASCQRCWQVKRRWTHSGLTHLT